jgi:hypothetical protein
MIEICQVNFPFTLIYVSSMRQDLFVSRFWEVAFTAMVGE